ncbi:MAG: hypothetical protein M1812_004272 [Candelaria pacifica]|nr:MAG: hypothetical protein M1812_004272 [Candelaria pacifica]
MRSFITVSTTLASLLVLLPTGLAAPASPLQARTPLVNCLGNLEDELRTRDKDAINKRQVDPLGIDCLGNLEGQLRTRDNDAINKRQVDPLGIDCLGNLEGQLRTRDNDAINKRQESGN